MIPILYGEISNTYPMQPINFTGNGVGALSDCIECLVTEERNGIYELEFKYPITGIFYRRIQENMTIKVTHDADGDFQYFTIYGRSAPIDGVVTFYAQHVSYFLNKLVQKPFTATSVANAFSHLSWRGQYGTNKVINRFTYETDNTTPGKLVYETPVINRSALRGIVDAFGGEYEFDNFTVKNLTSRGTDTGVVLQYGKDVIDLTQNVDTRDCFDTAIPYWIKDGQIKFPINDAVVGTGRIPRASAPLDLSKAFDTVPTDQQLIDKAQTYLDNVKPWLPKVSLKVDFIALWQTDEYRDVVPVTKLKLCDIVTISYPELGVDTKAKIVKVVWDALSERYTEMIIGDEQNSLAQTVVNRIQIENVYEFVNKYGDTMYGDLYIQKNRPTFGMAGDISTRLDATAPSSNTRVGSTYHKDNNEENNIVFYNETIYTPDKLLYTSFITRRYDANGENPILHGFYQRILNDGSVVTAFANTNSRNAWRTGLAVDKHVNQDVTTSTVADIITVNSTNATITSASYRQYGKVAQIYIAWTNASDISVPANGNVGNIVVGTLVSGKRPGITSCAVSKGDNGGQAWYAVYTGGQIHLSAVEGTGTSRTIAAGTQFEIFATFILP